MSKILGRKKIVELRSVFPNEARDFTPWLEKNIDELNKVIDIEIVNVKREISIGDFNVDLIGVETNSENKVIIENQIESTDHDHLGKLITYASGMGARYIIWIAKKIREEHQKAMEWLNENTNDSISFFGVEIEAIKIDDSLPAVNFKLVIEPNSWGREVKQKTEEIDERHQKYLQIFKQLITEYEEKKPEWSHLTPRPDSWLAFGAGVAGFTFCWAFRGNNRFDVELFIDTRDREETKNYFFELKKYEKEINLKFPDLSWEELPNSRATRIASYYKMPTDVKKLNDEEISRLIKWAIEKMDLFKNIFPKYIQLIK